MESQMNIGSDIFSSPVRQEEDAGESLTQRLYTRHPGLPEASAKDSTQKALDELRKLAAAEPWQEKNTSAPTRTPTEESSDLEQEIHSFQRYQQDLVKNYLELSHNRPKLLDYGLYILHGWEEQNTPVQMLPFSLLTEESRKSTGGHYVRLKGKGIVINPGSGFMENFHQQNLSIKDIDFVIVTRNHIEAHNDVKKIYELNNESNKNSSHIHIIHYYLQQAAYQELAASLKPNFRNARHTIHSLETYLDSPDVENVELSDGIRLHYFQTTQERDFPIVIRLEITDSGAHNQQGKPGIRLGYISGTGWSPLIAHHLGRCDVLLAGFGNTNQNDYTLLSYNEDTLGFYGTYSLFEEVAPRLMLCTEFGGREGDIRAEVIKKIREDVEGGARSLPYEPIALPGDIGLTVDLLTFKIQCSMSHTFVDPSQVRIVKTSESFGRLQYLAPRFCI